jgi:hypothetical protein
VTAPVCCLLLSQRYSYLFSADKIFLSKQREVLKLLNKVHEPNRFKDQADLGRSYDPTQHLSKYKVREHASARIGYVNTLQQIQGA